MASGGPGRANNDDIQGQIERITRNIRDAERKFDKNKGQAHRDSRVLDKLNDNVQQLRANVHESNISYDDKQRILSNIREMVSTFEKKYWPNLRARKLSPEQEELKRESLRIIEEWQAAGSGINLRDLSTEQNAGLNSFTSTYSTLETLLTDMMQKKEVDGERANTILARYNLAILIFKTLVCRFGLLDGHDGHGGDVNEPREHLKSCIANVAVARCTKEFNFLHLLPEAAKENPVEFAKRAFGFGFAAVVAHAVTGGVLPPIASGAAGLAGKAVTYAATNPVSGFLIGTSAVDAATYVNNLIRNALKRGQLAEEQYQQLFDELSTYYQEEGVRELIGVEPIDEDTVLSKLRQLLYKLQFRCVASTFGLRDIIVRAVQLPSTVCSSFKGMIGSAKKTLTGLGLKLIDKYGFIPNDIDESLFQEVITCLVGADEHGERILDDPDIAMFTRRYLQTTNPQIPFAPLVQLHIAQGNVEHPVARSSDSIEAVAGGDSQQEDLEELGFISDNDFELDERGNVIIIARRNVERDPFGSNLALFKSMLGSDGPHNYHGGMKTKRRKLPTSKKQKSKKNKRQSRRKARRSSSRKAGRK
jgi:hypothetical protein